MIDDQYFMNKAYEEALKAYQIDEVPVGAVVVKDNQIIARAHNQRQTKQSVLAHGEALAIEIASKKLNSWRLDECTLYVTLEPCLMCTGIIVQSRIKRVVFGCFDTRWSSLSDILSKDLKFNHQVDIDSGILEEQCSSLIKQYFKEKR